MKKVLSTIGLMFGILAGMIAIAAGLFWVNRNYVFVSWHFYPRAATMLDLRERELKPESFDHLASQLPQCEILWTVPLSTGGVSSDATEITVDTMTMEDAQLLAYLPALAEIHAENCTDYDALMEASKPESVKAYYTVTIGGKSCDQDTTSVTAPQLTRDDLAMLQYLPKLTRLDASGCEDYALVKECAEENPDVDVSFTMTFGDQKVNSDEPEAALSGITLQDARQLLTWMPKLQKLTLQNPDSDGEALVALRQEFPDREIHWELLWGETAYGEDTVELDISAQPLESIDQAKKIAAYFPNLEKLIVDSGEIDNDTMAEFREEMRSQYKVVWTVICGRGEEYFGSFAIRTDETAFMPLKHRIYWFRDADMVNAKYCEDIIVMDVGHMSITDVSFVYNMPHLKYLILNLTSVKDITPLSSCKELVFLELDHSYVQDYSPLLECTALEDLNLGDTWGDPAPIAKMTWLKNLWWVRRSLNVRNELAKTLTETNMLFRPDQKNTTSFGWRHLPNYYAMRDALGMPYME